MKKLLITTMAAVSVGLCAKADDTGFISGTSFETVPVGSYLATNGQTTVCKWFDENGAVWSDNRIDDPEKGYCYWVTEATDAQLVVSNLSSFAGDYLLNADRPKEWIDESNTKALYIDTDKPLMRYVNYSADDIKCTGKVLNNEIFIDSVVQFTATDVPAEPDSADKLRVWLYASPGNLDDGVFSENDAVTNLVVTAGYYKPNDNSTYKTNYLTDVSIDPDSWHRLTIKTFVKEGYTKFNIYVDGEIVKVGDLQDFDSLIKEEGQNSLQCVAFDGKGAVDDIVFTTTDPFYVPPVEAETYAIVATCDNASTSISFSLDEAGNESLNDVSALDVKTTTVYGYVIPESGYEVTSAKFNGSDLVVPEFDGLGYTFLLPIGTPKNGDEYAFVVTVTKKSEGGEEPDPEEPTTPTVGGTSCETEADLKAVVKAGTQVTVPSGWIVDGKVLKDNTGATFATFEYYNLALVDGVVTATLDQKAAAPFAEATDLTEGQEVLDLDATMKDDENNDVPAVGIRIKTFNGLYYGLGTATQLGTWTGPASWTQSDSDGKIIQLVAPKQGDTRFYRIEVRDVDPTPAQ